MKGHNDNSKRDTNQKNDRPITIRGAEVCRWIWVEVVQVNDGILIIDEEGKLKE